MGKTFIIPAPVAQRLAALHNAVLEADARKREAVALVLLTLGAPPNSVIDMQTDGTGLVVVPDAAEDNDAHAQ